MSAIERTLVLLKPDGVERGISGEILTRFEKAGFKIVGLKMAWVTKDFAKKHYTEDLEKRRGKKVRQIMVDFLSAGPVIVIALEGIQAIDNVRKLVGPTEPLNAPPGTIRGDYSHVSFAHANAENKAVKNLIHASENKKDAKSELSLWFKKSELHSYSSVHEKHTF